MSLVMCQKTLSLSLFCKENPCGNICGLEGQRRKLCTFKTLLRGLFRFLFASHTHLAADRPQQPHRGRRGTHCGILCLLKENNKQEQALGKAILTDRHGNEVPFHKQLCHAYTGKHTRYSETPSPQSPTPFSCSLH